MADEKVKPVSCSFVDGVGSSQAVDTTAEIVDLAGIDCSSFIGGALNWEHLSQLPGQVVGKVLEYKKIFSEKDCENDRHKYYWDKCKTPYLYVMGRLFDDKKPSAVECAALFKDDAEHPDEHPMVGFSIEGSKVDKKGMIVTKSIARKMTITGAPANKQCVAELVPNPDLKDPKTDSDSIFKSEPTHTIELLSKAETGHEKGIHRSQPELGLGTSKNRYQTMAGTKTGKEAHKKVLSEIKQMPKPNLGKAEVPGSNIKPAHPAPGPSKAVKGAPGWSHTGGGNFSHPEHGVVSVVKEGGKFNVKHKGGLAGVAGKKGSFGSSKEAGSHAGDYMRSLSQGKTMGAEMHERPSPGMAKAMSAGSGMAAPGNLSGGAALSKESLDKKMKKAELNKAVGDKTKEGLVILKEPASKKVRTFTPGMDKPSMIPSSEVGSKIPSPKKMKKAEWLARAEEAYQSWGKREQFENFMAKHMPDLAKGEVQTLGQVLALRKSLRAEKKLAKMVDQGQDSYVNKSDKK